MIKESFRVIEHVLRLYNKNLGMVKVVMGLHHRNLRMVKLKIGLHHQCPNIDQEVSKGGEASDGALPRQFQGGEVHDGALPWKFQRK